MVSQDKVLYVFLWSVSTQYALSIVLHFEFLCLFIHVMVCLWSSLSMFLICGLLVNSLTGLVTRTR